MLQHTLHIQHGVVTIYANRFIGKQQHTKHSCSLRVFEEPLHVEFAGQRTSQCSDSFAGHPGIQSSIVIDSCGL
jgi:hypothetical protein